MEKPRSEAYLVFHLNLAFSSIETERRREVLEKCYWPLLKIPDELNIPIGIELSGWTLQQIKLTDQKWIEKLKDLIKSKKVEIIGSGFTQMIGPLVPESVNHWNQKIGLKFYKDFLGTRPEIALVNEMAFSKSMIDIYSENAYEGFIMDIHNINLARGSEEKIKYDHLIYGLGNRSELPVIWADTILFQKFQQYIHGDISIGSYLQYINKKIDEGFDPLPIYSNDIEIFDFRPGRFSQERDIYGDGEWNRMYHLLSVLSEHGIQWISPSEILKKTKKEETLDLTSCSYPIPVKKQPKYNIARWAVTGRDDFWLNTICFRIEKYLSLNGVNSESEWKQLCEFWSSDYRTHITESRWSQLKKSLEIFLDERGIDKKIAPQIDEGKSIKLTDSSDEILKKNNVFIKKDENFLEISNVYQSVILNLRRGCTVKSLLFCQKDSSAYIGTIDQGYFESIELGADFYTGGILFDSPRSGKRFADLEPVDPKIEIEADGTLILSYDLSFDIGNLSKKIKFFNSKEGIEFSYSFKKSSDYIGTIRVGGATFLPEFTKEPIIISCKNGGDDFEEFIPIKSFDHSRPSSTMVSSSRGFGATDGKIIFQNDMNKICFEWDQSEGAALPMMQNIISEPGNLMRLFFSLREIDETTKESSDFSYFRYRIKSNQ